MSKVQILQDSISRNGKDRFTTFLIEFPKVLLAELNTHRMLVRNVGSSRAIPSAKMIAKVIDDPYIPKFTLNQKGMQGSTDVDSKILDLAILEWKNTIKDAIDHVTKLAELGIHKQNANRPLDCFLNIDTLLSGTEWDNFYNLRNHPDAQPDFKDIAAEMLELSTKSNPVILNYGDWHIPFSEYFPENLTLEQQIQIAVARCARISYESHDGQHSIEKDFELFERLISSGHYSPLEHIAMCIDNEYISEMRYIDPKFRRFFFYDSNVDYCRFTRNYSGFYTYRSQKEDLYF